MDILFKVPAYHTADDPFICLGSLADGTRFKQKQHPLGSVPIGVVLAPDLMDDVMAECHVSECPGCPRFLVSVLLENLLDV